MNIQLEINGEPYTGSAFKTNDGIRRMLCIRIHLPGVQAASAAPFETLFQSLPENKLNGGFLEVGKWNGTEFSFETQVTFGVGPDGKVWAQVCNTPGKLPYRCLLHLPQAGHWKMGTQWLLPGTRCTLPRKSWTTSKTRSSYRTRAGRPLAHPAGMVCVPARSWRNG